MAQLPNKGELKKIAKELGYTLETKTGGRHASKFVNYETGHKVPVPAHGGKDIKKGTLVAILKAIGYNEVRDNVAVHLDLKVKNVLITADHIAKAKGDGFDIRAGQDKLKQNKDWQKVRILQKSWKKEVRKALRNNTDIPSTWKDYKEKHWNELPKKQYKHHSAFNN